MNIITVYLDAWELRLKTRGLEDTLKHYKNVRLCFTRFLSGQPFDSFDNIHLIEGIPKEIFPFVEYYRKSSPECYTSTLKVIMTLLSIGRAFKIRPVLDTSTITEPSKCVPLEQIFDSKAFTLVLKRLKVTKTDLEFSSFHMSSKTGPNGPAMTTCLTDLTSLPLQLKEDISLLGGDLLGKYMNYAVMKTGLGFSMSDLMNKLLKREPRHIRKLSYFSDKEGKSRVIAIFDYWSQCALRPLHFHLMDVLRRLKQDCTFNQDGFHQKLPKSGPYFCFDLSAATDRMPLSLQKMIVSQIVGEDKAEAWARILSSIGFQAKGISDLVYYKAGQPMGAYSSWAAMALTHHFIVQLAAYRAGFNRYFYEYVLLGDDLVIADAAVAVQYKILCSLLDMPISEQKTHVSNDTFEFAKRWFHKGEEITGYSIGGLLSTYGRYSTYYEFELNQQQHGWCLPCIDGKPGLISDIYDLMGRVPTRPVKLYMLFSKIKAFSSLHKTLLSMTGDKRLFEVELERKAIDLYYGLSNFIGLQCSLPDLLMVDSQHPFTRLFDALLRSAKMHIVKEDIRFLQSENQRISKARIALIQTEFPDLSDHLIRNLWELTYPPSIALEQQRKETINFVNDILSPNPTLNIFKLGVGKYFLGDRVFSLRTSQSISLAESQLTKVMLYHFRILLQTLVTFYPDPNSLGPAALDIINTDVERYEPKAMRRREKAALARRHKAKMAAKLPKSIKST